MSNRKAAPICAIYAITNIVTGEQYIGGTSDLRKRWYQHRTLLNTGRHSNKLLQRAFDQYGKAAFRYEILEVLLRKGAYSWDIREKEYIEELKPAYNENKRPPLHYHLVGINMSDEMHARIRRACNGTNQTASEWIRNAIERCLPAEE